MHRQAIARGEVDDDLRHRAEVDDIADAATNGRGVFAEAVGAQVDLLGARGVSSGQERAGGVGDDDGVGCQRGRG